MEPTKVISLLQPWASAVILGHKQLETRSWQTKHRGLLLIHASKMPSSGLKMHQVINQAGELTACGLPSLHTLPFGAIIGHAYLVGIQSTDLLEAYDEPHDNGGTVLRHRWRRGLLDDGGQSWPEMSPKEYRLGDYSAGRYAWRLVDPVVYPEPIPCKGSLSVWSLPEELRLQVAEQMRQAADAMAAAGGGDAAKAFQLGSAWSQLLKPDVQLVAAGAQEPVPLLGMQCPKCHAFAGQPSGRSYPIGNGTALAHPHKCNACGHEWAEL